MTISSTTNRNDYTGAGSTDNFDFTFSVLSQNDLRVIEKDDDGVETVHALTTDYTVALNADKTGSITLTAGNLATGHTLTIRRVRNLVQETDIRNQGDFFPEAHEDALDHNVMLAQQQQDEIDRSMKVPESITSSDFSATLPTNITSSANKALVINSDGDGIVAGPTTTEISNAQTNATSASTSATNAATSATNAATSATNASTSATNAASSATTAQAAANSTVWSDVVFKTNSDSPIAISDSDKGKLFSVDCSGGAVVFNLAQISTLDLTNNWSIGIKKTDSSGNAITINRGGTDEIDGNTSATIQNADSGFVLVPDVDPSPDHWTTVAFGAVTGDMTVDRFSGTGSQTDFTLSVAPGSENNTQVYVGGTYQQKDDYSVSGTTLSFSTAPASGTDNIEVVIGTTVSIGTPADGTITTAKIADDAVTPEKIASSVESGITASTTQSQGQQALTKEINEVSTVANDGDTVTLKSAEPGARQTIINNGANYMKIFPASGDDLGNGADTHGVLAAGSTVTLFCYDSTTWNVEGGLVTLVKDIGDWNMDTTASVNIAHGLASLGKVGHVSAWIRNDGDTERIPFSGASNQGNDSTVDLHVSVHKIQSSNGSIVLLRKISGAFDGTGWNSTSYNRGQIIMQYSL